MTMPKIVPASVLAVFLLGACASLPPEEEMAMAEEQVQEVNAALQLIDDPAVLAYLETLTAELLAGVASPPAITVRIIDSDGFNAFAISGGNIYLTAGTIKASYNVAELASILAHELAHVVHGDHRRFYRSFRTTRALANITGVVLAVATGNPFIAGAGDFMSDLGATTYISTHTRTQERAADELAFNLMVEAGYDPRSQMTLFTRLDIHVGDRSDTPAFLQTHPLPRERIQDTQARLASLPAELRLRVHDDGALEQIKRRL